MSTQIEVAEGTSADRPFVVAHHRALVIGSRTAMLMLLIAALAVLGLGILALIRGGGPEVDGVLRTLFGKVFAVVAGAMAAVLGIPAAIGLAAMSGANAEDAVPALGVTPRRVLVGVAVATVGVAPSPYCSAAPRRCWSTWACSAWSRWGYSGWPAPCPSARIVGEASLLASRSWPLPLGPSG